MSLRIDSVGLNQPYSKQITMRANSEQTVQSQEQVQTQPEYTLTDVFKYEHKKNGLVERAYNGVKNLTGLGTGSKKVKAVIAKAEKGEISEEEAQKTIDKYRKSQANSAQAFGDVLSIGSSGMTFFALRNYLKKLGAEAVVNKENQKLFLFGIDKKSLWNSFLVVNFNKRYPSNSFISSLNPTSMVLLPFLFLKKRPADAFRDISCLFL